MKNLAIAGRAWRACAAAVLLLAFGTAYADSGSLEITVRNVAGEPVAGATVHASTPDSLTERSGVTDADGVVRLVGLDPSNRYEVSVSGEGFDEVRDTNVKVVSDRTFSLDYFVGGPGEGIEEVVVTGEGVARQMVDTTSAMVGTDVTLDLTESLPTGRSYQSYLQLAPTTKPTLNGNPSSKSGVNYSDVVDANGNTFGSSSDNVYYIDGINITDNLTGTFGANFNSEIIQEMQIITGGVPAEYAGGQGLISRVITKSGSNEWHGSVNYYTQSDSLVADNENLPNSTFSTFDTAFTLGGPIIQDQLWFFASMQRKEREEDIIDPVTGNFSRTVNTTEDLGFFKLTWQPNENEQLVAEFFNDPFERDGSANTTTLNSRDSIREQGGDNYKLAYSRTLLENLIGTVHWYRHEGEVSSLAANNETRNDVAFSGQTGITNADTDLGGSGSNNIDFRNRRELGFTLEYFLDTDSWGYHDIKFGYSTILNKRKRDLVFTGDGAQYSSIGAVNSGTTLEEYANGTWIGTTDISEVDVAIIRENILAASNSQHFFDMLNTNGDAELSDDEILGIVFDSTAGNPHGQVNAYRIIQEETAPLNFETKGDVFFLQDSWEINDHWTVNAGIRAEKWAHYATDDSKIFEFDYELAPRLSVVYDLHGDGSSKIWAFGGRYFDPIRTNMTAFAGTLTGSLRNEQIFIGDQWLTFRVRGGTENPDAFFAPATKTPYTDEFMIGYEQALTDDMSIGITVTDRRTRDILEDYDLGLYTDPTLTGAGEFALPLSYFGYDSIPISNFVIGTLAGGKRDYTGAELTFRKRRTFEDRYQLLASYSYNDAEGSSNSDSDADFQGDVVWLDPRARNMYGPQPGNVEHILKLAGSYAWDNGFEVGAVYAWNSGTLYSRTFLILSRHLPVTGPAFEDRGTVQTWVQDGAIGGLKTEAYGTLDLRAKYTMELFDDRYQAEFFLDIFNVLDDQSPRREQDLDAGDGVFTFGEANAWVEPRRFYLGARFSF